MESNIIRNKNKNNSEKIRLCNIAKYVIIITFYMY